MHGIIPPVVTLLDHEGNIDLQKNFAMFDFLIEKGVHGLLILGSSGEFPHFSLEEKKQYLKEVATYVNKRVPLLAGTGGTVLEDTIELTQYAAQQGYDGVLIVNPYYWKLTDEQLYSYFFEVASAVSIDVYLYNIPQITGQMIPISIIKKLIQTVPNVKGIKETVASIDRIKEVLREVHAINQDFAVFSAFDAHLFEAKLFGAKGSINGTSVFFPEASVALYEAIEQKDYEQISEWHFILSNLMDIYSWHPSFYLTMKEGIHARLFPDEPIGIRKPFINTEVALRSKIENLLLKYNVLDGVNNGK